ncbi:MULTISPECIES: hypothetical protein [unclassified Streptomyces]|uniref:hypothetical protein n=1 Tax=unclassified Streptomyces TaxID=2593676 RepID=UPI0033E51515
MSTNAASKDRSATTERLVASAETLAPIATGITAPLLDGGAAFTTTMAYGVGAAFVAANYMNRLSPALLDQMPASDIITAHRTTLGISTLTAGMALAMGVLQGPSGADALMAGVLTLPSVPGILSLGWWAAVGLVPLKLRSVRSSRRKQRSQHPGQATGDNGQPATLAEQILRAWGTVISHHDTGSHKHQVLTDVHVYISAADPTVLVRWTGRILAPAGTSVPVNHSLKLAVSSLYKTNPAWITIRPGEHAGEAHITVNYQRPAELDPTTLAGAWAKYAARPGGLMPHTHLEQVQPDPNTGGEAAYVVADDDLDLLKTPSQMELAGALRTSPLLVSYEPVPNDPRRAKVRIMKESPLEKGFPFPGLDAMTASKGGRIPLGRTMPGHPAMLPIIDPTLGALHFVVIGATGSGKGGAVQVICLGYHANGAAILYADPKAASNPAIPKMAAYSGLGDYGALGTLRVSYALAQHRKAEAARYELKNFQPSAMRPLAPTILDEANKLLAPGVANRKEAVHIVGELTSQGRFIGMPVGIVNHVLNLEQIGGEQAIRSNLIYGGSWLILRCDRDQMNLADLPDGFKGIDPADIPAVWSTGEDSLIYDPEMPDNDPLRTFGLGFLAAPGGRPGMQRIWTLEDATDHIQRDKVAIPEDFPDWSPGYLEEIANTPIPGFETKSDSTEGDGDSNGPRYTSGVDLPKKEPSADESVIKVLTEHADPLHLDALNGADLDPDEYEVQYVSKAALLNLTGLNENTLTNTLGRLVRAKKIHRKGKGEYGLGPGPDSD